MLKYLDAIFAALKGAGFTITNIKVIPDSTAPGSTVRIAVSDAPAVVGVAGAVNGASFATSVPVLPES